MTARVTSSAVSRLAVGDRLELLVAQHDDQHQCVSTSRADGAEHEVGRDRVGELGEQDDHRAPGELARRASSARTCNWSRRRYSRSARRSAAARRRRRRPRPGRSTSRGRESKAWSATRSPSLSATQAVSSIAETAAVDPRQRRRPARTSAARYRSRRRSGCCARCDIPWRAASCAAPTASSRSRGGPCPGGIRPARRNPSPRRGELGDQALERVALEDLRAAVVRPGGGRAGSGMPPSTAIVRCCQARPSGPASAATAARTARCRAAASRAAASTAPAPAVERHRAAGRRPRARPAARSAAPPRRSRGPAADRSRVTVQSRGLADIGMAAESRRAPSPSPSPRSASTAQQQQHRRAARRAPGYQRAGRDRGDGERDGRARGRRDHRRARRIDQRGASIASMIAGRRSPRPCGR